MHCQPQTSPAQWLAQQKQDGAENTKISTDCDMRNNNKICTMACSMIQNMQFFATMIFLQCFGENIAFTRFPDNSSGNPHANHTGQRMLRNRNWKHRNWHKRQTIEPGTHVKLFWNNLIENYL